jgi:hypothetical protein
MPPDDWQPEDGKRMVEKPNQSAKNINASKNLKNKLKELEKVQVKHERKVELADERIRYSRRSC